jgi:hypothetical protein
MATRRPYKVNVRWLGTYGNGLERGVTFAAREGAFHAANARLAERIADQQRIAERKGEQFDPTRWDVVVSGPDSDLGIAGRVIRHDGSEADLMQTITEGAQKSRDALHKAGWTDEDIERGRKA